MSLKGLVFLILCNILICVAIKRDYLINTQNCKIPTFDIKYNDKSGTVDCGERKISVTKINDNQIEFIINKNLEHCCYYFITRSNRTYFQDRLIDHSNCTLFLNGTIARLRAEVVRVLCIAPFYEDIYVFVKKVEITKNTQNPWNVLMIGMDSMSRSRALVDLRSTTYFFRSRRWLEFRGFHKVGGRTYENLMPFLYNMTLEDINRQCAFDFEVCRNMSILEQFKAKGYVTAYGMDDFIEGPIQQSVGGIGYSIKPADHYLDTLYLAGEKSQKRNKSVICTKHMSSGEHMLHYALDFAKTYKKENFFGFFFMATYSHDVTQSPKMIDYKLRDFFKDLERNGILQNTFIIFFSDHGLSYGPVKLLDQSIYEERMPMLFMKTPVSFKTYTALNYIRQNQAKMINILDLHLTLMDILTNFKATAQLKHAACPICRSLLKPVVSNRSCADAGIKARYCACNGFMKVSPKGTLFDQIAKATIAAVEKINTKSKEYVTTYCSYCKKMTFEKTLRIHRYQYEKDIYFLITMLLKPADLVYEFWLKKNENRLHLTGDIMPISKMYDVNFCAPNTRYCVCGLKKHCL